MGEKKKDGGPAFPGAVDTCAPPGMSLRDWFAGQALAGILAGGFADTIPHDDANGGQDAAFFAYQYADAMLMERSE
jgi:hypothetical protein